MASPTTITQIAAAAGVSTATVDRVLNGRPGVNPATMQKVLATMQALGAGMPTRGRPRTSSNYRFGFVLPAARLGFPDQVGRVIAQAAGDFRHQHITEVTRRLASDNAADFATELARQADFDALAVMAPDVPAVKLAINDLVRAGVQVVTLFSDVPGSMRAAFVGADNRAAGRTAALLLGRSLGPAGRAAHAAAAGQTAAQPPAAPALAGRLALFCADSRFAAEIDREIGFTHAQQERHPHAEVWRVPDLPAGEDEAFEHARAAIASLAEPGASGASGGSSTAAGEGGPALTAAYVTGSGSPGVVRALEAAGYGAGLTVAVHDLLETHRAMLVGGQVTYVLHQDVHYAVLTATRMLRSLCEGLRGALAVSSPRVEIMTAENLA